MNKKKKIFFGLGISIVSLILIAFIGFFIYASIYYKAEDGALKLLEEEYVEKKDGYILINSNEPTDTMFIFYPGAKVEEEAYLPILVQIREGGITCVLVEMPFRMAILDQSAADEIINEYEHSYDNFYIGGHSMGGAAASSYAAKNQDKIEGLILLGAYMYGDYSPADTLTIYGSLNQSVEDKIDYTENVIEIEGGNHAQFGNYGHQKGDAYATITASEQQSIASTAIIDFINARI